MLGLPLSPAAWRNLSLTGLDAQPALTVLGDLDPNDRQECALTAETAEPDLLLRGFWAAEGGGMRAALVWDHAHPHGGAEPFALVAVGSSIGRGVGQAALLSRDHAAWRRPLRRLVCALRADLPALAGAFGLRRMEARCWSAHPTAAGLLTACGFAFETALPGYVGAVAPDAPFHQYARVFS